MIARLLILILSIKSYSIYADIAILNFKTSELDPIPLELKNVEEPEWSPDGTKILFDAREGRNRDLYMLDSISETVTRLTAGPAKEDHGSWSPDGNRIAYQSQFEGNTDVYVMNADGSNPKRLTHNSARDGWPDWSPDGSQIVFSSERSGHREIYLMNTDGSGQTRLTHTEFPSTDPAFSPDGSKIAFNSDRDGNSEIYIMNSDGSNPIRLTDNEHHDERPAWSPDGKLLHYSRTNLRYNRFELYAIEPYTKSELRISPKGKNLFRGHWSPTHKKIVSQHRPSSPKPNTDTIAKIDPSILDNYVGVFQAEDRPKPIFTFTRKGDRFYGQVDNGPIVELSPFSETAFFPRNLPGEIDFIRNDDGSASKVIINLGKPITGIRIK